MKKRLILFKRLFRVCQKYIKLDNISEDLRKIAMVFIPAGIIGIIASGDKITSIESIVLIVNGVVIYLISLLLQTTLNTKKNKSVNLILKKLMFSSIIWISKLLFLVALIAIIAKLFF